MHLDEYLGALLSVKISYWRVSECYYKIRKADLIMAYGQHQSFYLRDRWLNKAIKH